MASPCRGAEAACVVVAMVSPDRATVSRIERVGFKLESLEAGLGGSRAVDLYYRDTERFRECQGAEQAPAWQIHDVCATSSLPLGFV